jgi:hypothetical protein
MADNHNMYINHLYCETNLFPIMINKGQSVFYTRNSLRAYVMTGPSLRMNTL